MRALVLVFVLILATTPAAGCGGNDDGEETSAAEQAEQTDAKAVRCSQRSFRVAFDPDGTIVVASSDDTLASLSESEQTVSGRCTIASESDDLDESGLEDDSSEKITLVCNVRAPADFVVRGTSLTIAVRPETIVSATVGGSVRWSNVCLPEEDR